jgi:hypothetical protein
MKVVLKRKSDDKFQTLGEILMPSGKTFHSLELPWRKNASRVSCIPKGTYEAVKRTSEKYGEHFHVLNVPGRDFILIHQGNFYTQILGCILPGKGLSDVNKDGRLDVTSSKQAMREMLAELPAKFTLEIQ